MLYKPVWEYIPMNQYSRPMQPATETMRQGIVSFWNRVHPVSRMSLAKWEKLDTISPYLLNRAAPTPDSTQIVAALHTALQGWHKSGNDAAQSVQLIVGAPGSGVDRIVTEMARQEGWQIVGAPSSAQILEGGTAWLEKVTEDGLRPLVLPQLGKCYLRHQEGLQLMSRLLDWIQTSNRRCLIACDSWAWAYLVKALQIDVLLPMPLTLAPFDGARLQFWLPSLAQRIHKNRFEFRDVSNGQPLFPMAEQYEKDMMHLPEQEALYGDWVAVSHFFRQMAAFSRGVPGIVWAIWRQGLQVTQELNVGSEAVKKIGKGDRYTVWVQSWSQLELPIMPSPVGTDESFVLHSLLLHGGMTAALLADLLPLSYNQVRRILHFFGEANVVEQDTNEWRVSLLAYSLVRQFLEHEGYLVDAF